MADLYNRDIRIIAGPLTIEPRTAAGESQPMLALEFDVSKSLASTPNTATLSIWNLRSENRSKLQEKGLEVTIEAGYVSEIVQIFKGDIDASTISRDSVNWVTRLELTDGGKALKSARINQSFRGGQSVGQMLQKAAEALGLDTGNLADKVKTDGARSALKELVSGVVLSGSASDVVEDLAASMGLKFSVQDKKLSFLAKGEASSEPAIQLDSATGLLGSPSIGEKGVIRAQSLLNGRITPGRRVSLSSAVATGTFITKSLKHKGATWGDAWTTELELAES